MLDSTSTGMLVEVSICFPNGDIAVQEVNTYVFGAAVTPDEAAQSLASFIETFDMSKTGEYWAPRGPG